MSEDAFCARPVTLDQTVRFPVPAASARRGGLVRVYDAEGRLLREIDPFVTVRAPKGKGERPPQPLWPEKKTGGM